MTTTDLQNTTEPSSPITTNPPRTKPAPVTQPPVTTAPPRDLSDVTGPVVALTFDDGPKAASTQALLDVLVENHSTASFFMVGKTIDRTGGSMGSRTLQTLFQNILAAGCTIECHSMTHEKLTEGKTAEQLRDEYLSVSQKIQSICGYEPLFFRPPWLQTNNMVYDNIPLTFIGGGSGGVADWDASTPVEDIANRIRRDAVDGQILLLHDTANVVEALRIVLPELCAAGYTFVNVAELFEIKGKSLTSDPDTAEHRQMWSNLAR